MSLVRQERPIQQMHFRLLSDLAEVEKLLDRFEQFAATHLSAMIYWQSQTALVEWFTNVVRYAHKDLPAQTPIPLGFTLFPTYLEMRIWDQGKPFDLKGKIQEVLEQEDDLSKEGGRGLRWIHNLTDEYQYIRPAPDYNCLILRKRIDPPLEKELL